MFNRKLVTSALLCGAMVASPDALPGWYPDSMVALGDSITRATLADNSVGGVSDGQPEHSWATGYDSRDGVRSHYERILAEDPTIKGHYWNLAESGAKADDLPGQARAAVKTGAEYVVILMGANDVCAEEASRMTTTDAFRYQYEQALETLTDGLPEATIVVAAVPRVRRVYDVGGGDFFCRVKWSIFQWCDNVLRNGSTQRYQADARNIEYNNALLDLSADYGVIYDDGPFVWQFEQGNLSEIDCFHPDLSGQRGLAEMTFDDGRF